MLCSSLLRWLVLPVEPQWLPTRKIRTQSNTVKAAKAGLRYTGFDQDTTKHSCKGKNDCKGQGGCKSSDNGCKGKNSCKGKGGCATDGSKMPKAHFA